MGQILDQPVGDIHRRVDDADQCQAERQSRAGQMVAIGQKPARVGQLALGREPRKSELDAALTHLEAQAKRFASRDNAAMDALASLCHVLLNTNEFLYVD